MAIIHDVGAWVMGITVIVCKFPDRIRSEWCGNGGWGCGNFTVNGPSLGNITSRIVDQAVGARDIFEMVTNLGNRSTSVLQGKPLA